MDQKTIRRIRRKFIINAMLTLVLVMGVSASVIYVVNLTATRNQIMETMDYIAENNGEIQDAQLLYSEETSGTSGRSSGASITAPSGQFSITPGRGSYDVQEFFRDVFGSEEQDEEDTTDIEESYYVPYFAVTYDTEGNVVSVKANHMDGLTADAAITLSDNVVGGRINLGQSGDYYYNVRTQDDGTTMVIYLNAESQVSTISRLMYSAFFLTIFGALIMFVFVWLFSTRAIEPLIRNAELQQQFITNASHELKTPLAVIKANTEMQEILTGENEWTESTLRQVDRLNALIGNLVTITRAQENESVLREEMDVSAVVTQTVETYLPVAQQDGKLLEKDVPDGIRMRAAEPEIRQLTTLLLDNAIKYCDGGGTIRLTLLRKTRETVLTVSNTYAAGKDVDYSRFFERFYRGDESHTIEGRSGFGIGLSIAESLVKTYNGSIRAEWKDGVISFVCVLK